jgi:hypothetical protein
MFDLSAINTSGSSASSEEAKRIFNSLKHAYETSDGICPYCNANYQCVHWTGLGWARDKTEFTFDLPPKRK